MTRSLNDLHPTPNAEVVADMEMQPERYDVVSIGSAWSRPDAEDVPHARARVVFAFGKGCTREELNALAVEALADLHAFLETKHVVRLDYQPGTGDGPVPPDAALDTITEERPQPMTDQTTLPLPTPVDALRIDPTPAADDGTER